MAGRWFRPNPSPLPGPDPSAQNNMDLHQRYRCGMQQKPRLHCCFATQKFCQDWAVHPFYSIVSNIYKAEKGHSWNTTYQLGTTVFSDQGSTENRMEPWGTAVTLAKATRHSQKGELLFETCSRLQQQMTLSGRGGKTRFYFILKLPCCVSVTLQIVQAILQYGCRSCLHIKLSKEDLQFRVTEQPLTLLSSNTKTGFLNISKICKCEVAPYRRPTSFFALSSKQL